MQQLRLKHRKGAILIGLVLAAAVAQVQGVAPHWEVTQLPWQGYSPSVNNSGEVVWETSYGIFSSTRNQLTSNGMFPQLTNEGEVVYAGWFGGPGYDLVSTTRGRLTFGAALDLNASHFDANRHGEVVYGARDASGHVQIFSSVRGQITFDPWTHWNPTVNDLGEITWQEWYSGLIGTRVVSNTRGLLDVPADGVLDLNNLGEFCYSASLPLPPNQWSWPHLFSSEHGVIVPDPLAHQYGGSINDVGTIVWWSPDSAGKPRLYQAQWIVPEPTTATFLAVAAGAWLGLRWRRARSL